MSLFLTVYFYKYLKRFVIIVKDFFQTISIRTKLTLAILFSCTLLLVIVGGSFLAVELHSSRAALIQEVSTLASSLATNSSRSLVLGKYSEIEETLSSLRQQKNIHAAYLFDLSGKPVAEYLNQNNSDLILTSLKTDFTRDGTPFLLPDEEHQIFDSNHLSCFVPVYFADKSVGSIYLLSDLSTLYARLKGVAYGFILAFVLLLLGSWQLARWVQKPLSTPLVKLSDVMGQVSESKNYSIRAEKMSTDEVGSLVDGFNRMLEQIEQQQDELILHQAELEQTVTERTAELRETVDQLDQARHLADSANEAKSEFLSKMTHELRTPLIGVLGMNELLQRTDLDERQMLLTDTVQKSGEELLKLISDVLDISRIEAGRLVLEPAAVDLHQIVEDVACLLFPMARNKGLDLVTDISHDATWRVYADENRIRQIVMNLIGNAIKFTSSGRVVVSLKCSLEDNQHGLFTLSVADTGIGMDEQSKDRIFDLFYQSDRSGTREQQGSGLGLAIVRQLVDLMDGRLTLTSGLDRGSSFQIQVRLPLIEKKVFSIPQALIGETVFLCMDKSLERDILVERLTELNCKVDLATSADNAYYQLSAAQRNGAHYSLLLVDQTIQTVIGQPLFLSLREVDKLQSQRILLLCHEQKHHVSLLKNESKLQFPLCWSNLCDAVTYSWQSLQLISGPTVSFKEDNLTAVASAEIFLLGQKFASRELLRLVLAKSDIEVTLIDQIDGLITDNSANKKSCLLIDCPYLPEPELIEFLRLHRSDFATIVLFSSIPSGEGLASFDIHHLPKSLNEYVIETSLKPLLSDVIQQRGHSA
jgi:signal transduction histidine kinase